MTQHPVLQCTLNTNTTTNNKKTTLLLLLRPKCQCVTTRRPNNMTSPCPFEDIVESTPDQALKNTSPAVIPNDQWLEEESLSESMLKNMFIEQCNQNGDMLLYCMCTYNNIITEFGSLLDMPESFIESSDFQTQITFPCMEKIDIIQIGANKTTTDELNNEEQIIREAYMMSCDPDGYMTDFCDCTYQNLSARFGPMLDSPDGYVESYPGLRVCG